VLRLYATLRLQIANIQLDVHNPSTPEKLLKLYKLAAEAEQTGGKNSTILCKLAEAAVLPFIHDNGTGPDLSRSSFYF